MFYEKAINWNAKFRNKDFVYQMGTIFKFYPSDRETTRKVQIGRFEAFMNKKINRILIWIIPWPTSGMLIGGNSRDNKWLSYGETYDTK